MNKPLLAVITDDRFGSIEEERSVLEPHGIKIRVENCKSSGDVVKNAVDADALLVNMASVDKSAVYALKKCRVISRYGVGLDNIDLEACAEAGIKVYNVPGYCDREVAEHAMGLLLAISRGIPERNSAVKIGEWNITTPQLSIAGSSIAVFGFGGIAKAFAELALAFCPSRLMLWSPSLNEEKLRRELGAKAALFGVELQAVGFSKAISHADILSVHLKLNAETKALFNEAAFAAMKAGAIFINTSRGGLVDSGALAEALKSGRLFGAGLDVLDEEPPSKNHPLLAVPNLILSDHSAYRSVGSLSKLKRLCAENVLKGLL